jgi:hypothetical protein
MSMTSTNTATTADLWIGDVSQLRRSFWLSPLLVGLAAPVIAGLVLFPELLRDALGAVGLLLGLVLLIAIGAYVMSVLSPGRPAALSVQPESGFVSVVVRGPFAQSEIQVPFKEVAKLSALNGFDHDGYERSMVELKTRDGDIWIIPCEADESQLTRLRGLIGVQVRKR